MESSNQTIPSSFENSNEKSDVSIGYKPDLTLKKPSELRKVEILEEAVLKGTLEDPNSVSAL